MERESCLTMLIILLGGLTMLACGWWPAADARTASARALERIAWRRIWVPVGPALVMVAALCGWALSERDPVPEKVSVWLIALSLPCAALALRAGLRALGALLCAQDDFTTATFGLVRPRVMFSPYLARQLSDRQLRAALEHERAHARHRDPLRIWLAQLATDLQWPWPPARRRLQAWLDALEVARDEEARAAGVEGSDLAEVIVACARLAGAGSHRQAALSGEAASLKQRVQRLLLPLPAWPTTPGFRKWIPAMALSGLLIAALTLGAIFGEPLLHALFAITA
ncbi:MAG TPA: M56 family metallopeptidase [Candidatus Binataceae bacterium]|nr:M56 family metallopeptidase [Candidatus Binataceae bacterium]